MRQREIITEKQCFSRIGGAYFAMAAITMLLQTVAIIVVPPAELNNPLFVWVISLAPMYLVAVPVCAALLQRVPHARPQQNDMGVRRFGKLALICLGMVYAGSLLGQLVMQLVGMVRGAPVPDTMSEMMGQSSVLVNFVTTVLLAPIIEETLFRKLLIDRTRQFGDKFAIVLSGVMFGLFHGNFYQFFYAVGVGIVLAYAYTRTGRLRYSVALHMMINFIGAIITPFVLEYGLGALSTPILSTHLLIVGAYILLLFSGTLAGLVLLAHGARQRVLLPGECPLASEKLMRTVVGNMGMLAFFSASTALFIMNLWA